MTKPIEIYFHGIPGAPAELELFGPGLNRNKRDFHFARRDLRGLKDDDHGYELIAKDLRDRFPERSMRFVGFSLGAAAAIRTAPFAGDQVEQIDLVSPAAPLQLGRYLDDMAGAPVFRAASHSKMLFNMFSWGQSILARTAPSQLYNAMFAAARGADQTVCEETHFKRTMIGLLKSSLGKNIDTYLYEIRSYVSDWSSTLNEVTQPVSILHGQMDNWCPVDMAKDLALALPRCQTLQLLEDCSHYSTLRAYLGRPTPDL